MKILRVIRSLDPATGGPATGISSFTRALERLGCSTTILTLDKPDSPWLSNLDFNVIACGPVLGSYGFKLQLLTLLRDLNEDYDAVIIDGIWQFHSYATYLAFRSTSTPYFVYTHGMLDPWFKQKYPLKHIKKLLYWNLFEYNVLRSATHVFFTAPSEMLLAAQSFKRYTVNPLIIGFGVERPPHVTHHDVNGLLRSYPHLASKKIFLFLGRLHPKKGLELLIQGFSECLSADPSSHLLIAGTGAPKYMAKLTGLVNKLGMSSYVTFVGHLNGTRKWAAFSIAELFCLSSYQENFGVAVVEALATGLPVLLSSSINISEEVSSHEAGYVVRPTVPSIASSLMLWIQASASEKASKSSNALRLYNSKFTIDSAAERLLHAINNS
jgi:glycosyltransferase involved in cell wall biosynthesis